MVTLTDEQRVEYEKRNRRIIAASFKSAVSMVPSATSSDPTAPVPISGVPAVVQTQPCCDYRCTRTRRVPLARSTAAPVSFWKRTATFEFCAYAVNVTPFRLLLKDASAKSPS